MLKLGSFRKHIVTNKYHTKLYQATSNLTQIHNSRDSKRDYFCNHSGNVCSKEVEKNARYFREVGSIGVRGRA